MNNPTYIIIDFEATCDDSIEFSRKEMEIIEWGVIAIDGKSLLPISEFQSFTKPVCNPVLTEFCLTLTKIKQTDIEAAPEFYQVVKLFNNWLIKFYNPIFCSWGKYDYYQLKKDCNYHGIEYPFNSNFHINLKKLYIERKKINLKNISMLKALNFSGIKPTGIHHRGIDDARNIAKLMPELFK